MLIQKYTRQQSYAVNESADVYNKVTKPSFVDTLDDSHVSWMHNVLDGSKETELNLFTNEHFKLQKDYKFNEGDLKTFYCLAIPMSARDQKLKSVRDLTSKHLAMLKSIRAESYKAIESAYGLPESKVHAYFHYLPTYWLLHVHFVHADFAEKDARERVALDTVISNIEISGNYYSKCTLSYSVGAEHALCKALIAANVIK